MDFIAKNFTSIQGNSVNSEIFHRLSQICRFSLEERSNTTSFHSYLVHNWKLFISLRGKLINFLRNLIWINSKCVAMFANFRSMISTTILLKKIHTKFLFNHWQNYNNNPNSYEIDNIWLWNIHLSKVVCLNWRENPSVRIIHPSSDSTKEEINFICKFSTIASEKKENEKYAKSCGWNFGGHSVCVQLWCCSALRFTERKEKYISSSCIESIDYSLRIGGSGDGGSGDGGSDSKEEK